MLKRCTQPRFRFWKDYGGRGIKVSDEWLKFENFYASMGDRPEGLALDTLRSGRPGRPAEPTSSPRQTEEADKGLTNSAWGDNIDLRHPPTVSLFAAPRENHLLILSHRVDDRSRRFRLFLGVAQALADQAGQKPSSINGQGEAKEGPLKDFIHKSFCSAGFHIVTPAKSALSHTRKNISRQGVNCLPLRKVRKPGHSYQRYPYMGIAAHPEPGQPYLIELESIGLHNGHRDGRKSFGYSESLTVNALYLEVVLQTLLCDGGSGNGRLVDVPESTCHGR